MTTGIKPAWGTLFLLLGAMAMVAPNPAASQQTRDFLFGEPRFSMAFNMGYGIPNAGSQIYDDLTTIYTLESRDFSSMVFGGSLGIRVLPRVEVALELSYANSNTVSEYREFVGTDDLPIEQNTKLSSIPLTASVKAYLFERGREISRLAWVPGVWSPFIGAGGGRVFYNFKQGGEFVDYDTYEIFPDILQSKGEAGIFHVLAGAEYSLSPSFFITGEGRYSWAEAEMDRDYFGGYDPIDLSGFQTTVGLAIRF